MMAPVGAIQAEIEVRFNKKLFSHSCHEFKPRAVRAQALAAVACGGACASVFWFDSSLGRNYFSPHQPGRSFGFAQGRLAPRPHATKGTGLMDFWINGSMDQWGFPGCGE